MALWLNLIPQLHRPGDAEVSMRHHHFKEREQHYYAGNKTKNISIFRISAKGTKKNTRNFLIPV